MLSACQIPPEVKTFFQLNISTDIMTQTILTMVFLMGTTLSILLVSLISIYTFLPKKDLPTRPCGGGQLKSAAHQTSVILRGRQKIALYPDLKKEALAALNLAMDMHAQGKGDKALKLFQHALALDPLHADILNEYGEFIEKHEKDIIKADHLYNKVLMISPTHSRALLNRQRTMPTVEEMDQVRFKRIDKKRDQLFKIPSNHPALRRAKKEAYFLHIYHTNAIEGNTLTLAQTRAIVETQIAVGGKSLAEQNEVLGIDAALSFINSSLTGKVGSLTFDDILEIHKRVLGHVDPIEAGRLRTTQVYVGSLQPPGPTQLNKLIEKFILWLNSDKALKLHPIEYAALAHYKLVVIHPFYDGNGRTSRLLMNLILMQAGFPPVSIKVEDRARYYETLGLGNEGDVRPFIRFIAECAERTVDEFLYATVENVENLKISLPRISHQARNDRIILVETP